MQGRVEPPTARRSAIVRRCGEAIRIPLPARLAGANASQSGVNNPGAIKPKCEARVYANEENEQPHTSRYANHLAHGSETLDSSVKEYRGATP